MFTIILDAIFVLASLGFLILGAEWLMQGAVLIAKKKKISELVIASTLIAFGTGLPTIAVNIALVLLSPNGADAAVGNALGTNFVNIGLGLGIPAFLLTIQTKYQVFEKEIPIFLAVTGLLASFAMDGILNRFEGLIIFVSYLVTLFLMYQYSLREKLDSKDSEQVDLDTSTISETSTSSKVYSKAAFLILVGVILLIGSSIFLAFMSPKLSRDFGISEYILGLTIIGIGTSLPMIVTSVKSAYKGYVDIILGNVFGGTIANIGLGLGLVAIIKPLTFTTESVMDNYYFSVLNILVIFGILIEMKLLGSNKTLNKASGAVIVLFYLAYLITKIL